MIRLLVACLACLALAGCVIEPIGYRGGHAYHGYYGRY